jgi:hypothetical protein
MAHRDDVTAAIEEVIAAHYPESAGGLWVNNKPSGSTWSMTKGKWQIILNEILANLQVRIAPCVAPMREQLGDTYEKRMYEIRDLIDSKILCNEGAHQ